MRTERSTASGAIGGAFARKQILAIINLGEYGMAQDLFGAGSFVVGCNYWASHAGMRMWSDWRPEVVEADLAQLAKSGCQILRVFPLWPDFQPLHRLCGYIGRTREIRFREEPLGHDRIARAGLDPVMLDRFGILCDLSQKHGLRLIVGLITGWMSGRLFVPPALQGRNVITDPEAVQWQVRFAGTFVENFRDAPAICAWDLGNECNCMGAAETPEAAWCWTNAISSAIRLHDVSRPVISGMHSLKPDCDAPWRIQDQGELTDLLTTHPYPEFTAFCNLDPVHEIRNTLHAAAESRMYADISGKPCLAEEVGTLGPTFGNEHVAAAYLRTALWNLWANDCRALLWWCAYDQDQLTHAPYDWTGFERELGLLRSDRSEKKTMRELAAFSCAVSSLPPLPERTVEAVCILTANQDSWAAAFSAFILAKQAGFELRFQYADQPLHEAALYLLPSVTGDSGLSRQLWLTLAERVRAGATLYVSHQDATLQPFQSLIGAEVSVRHANPDNGALHIENEGQIWSCTAGSSFRLELSTTTAEVLGVHANGSPAFLRNQLGKGELFFLNGALEGTMSVTPDAFVNPATAEGWRIYARIARHIGAGRVVRKDNPFIAVTEHPVSDCERLVVAVNLGSQEQTTTWDISPAWATMTVLFGASPQAKKLLLPGNSAAVFRFIRKF